MRKNSLDPLSEIEEEIAVLNHSRPNYTSSGKHYPFSGCFVSDRGGTRPPRDSGFNESLR
ncbi:hypothetical protein L873DRAFT_1799854 [Choiromyces venosus 120613-1]|uniref:Uncharacterized protein n=1 Tax=Choiromyces venosus 120613-1 TaxID=1336337 RepID=A0A3N4K0V4_9PEZI|nr:hypothetical protein L873DRAFT_1799854 [Choiromyces venosus 120613-1]